MTEWDDCTASCGDVMMWAENCPIKNIVESYGSLDDLLRTIVVEERGKDSTSCHVGRTRSYAAPSSKHHDGNYTFYINSNSFTTLKQEPDPSLLFISPQVLVRSCYARTIRKKPLRSERTNSTFVLAFEAAGGCTTEVACLH